MKFTDSIILAYIAGFLDGDGSIFFQIVRRPDYKRKFQIRSSIAFYQDSSNLRILEWLKEQIGAGYIRHRKTGISDYTIVESEKVEEILRSLQPYVILKKKHIELGLEIIKKNKINKTDKEFIEICKLVDKFKELNYSKKRTMTSETVCKFLSP